MPFSPTTTFRIRFSDTVFYFHSSPKYFYFFWNNSFSLLATPFLADKISCNTLISLFRAIFERRKNDQKVFPRWKNEKVFGSKARRRVFKTLFLAFLDFCLSEMQLLPAIQFVAACKRRLQIRIRTRILWKIWKWTATIRAKKRKFQFRNTPCPLPSRYS